METIKLKGLGRFGESRGKKPLSIQAMESKDGQRGPIIQITQVYPYQSYFDDTLLEKAILQQDQAQPIVASTLAEQQVEGYMIGLHPSSQTPVAIEALSGPESPKTQTYYLKPGQIIRPVGSSYFRGFRYGLPFGWLGGGLANLHVFQVPEASEAWDGRPEIIFHRQRMQIVAAPTAAPYNWPMRFPWPHALMGANSVPQQGSPVLAVTPTRVIMSLRVNTLAAAATMRIAFQASNDFDLDSAGAPVLTGPRFVDYQWGTYAPVGGAGNLGVQYPMDEMSDMVNRLAADDGGVVLIDASGGELAEEYVDVVRYGVL